MKPKRKALLILFFVFFLGALAASFVFPQYLKVPGMANVPFRLGLDLQGGLHLVYEADLETIPFFDRDEKMQGLRDVIERRVNFFGISEPTIQLQGKGETRRLIVELAGIQDTNQAILLIGQTPYLEFKEYRENYQEILASNQQVLETGEGQLEDPFQATLLTGGYLSRAEVGLDNLTQEPLIILQFDKEGSLLFEELTKKNIGLPLAIFLDGALLQAPVVQGVISGGRAQITGSFTVKEAQRISRELNNGALPVPITLLSQQSVGATLGAESLQKSLAAGLLGLAFVFVFMILVYRIPGMVAGIALILYALFFLSLFKLISITLTLAGIAGGILSLGLAVDANILIFARMREELRTGKSFGLALEEGFKRAWPSIRDGNITTLAVALILFWFGSSFVKGFALTLSLGILVSLFSAIFITKNMLRLFIDTKIAKVSWLFR
ncbi:protein translocase subunit SecD [Patescibacteria group bacterium]|nr:protein translocase subunit SecD [Patescibacteria group bacterium]